MEGPPRLAPAIRPGSCRCTEIGRACRPSAAELCRGGPTRLAECHKEGCAEARPAPLQLHPIRLVGEATSTQPQAPDVEAAAAAAVFAAKACARGWTDARSNSWPATRLEDRGGGPVHGEAAGRSRARKGAKGEGDGPGRAPSSRGRRFGLAGGQPPMVEGGLWQGKAGDFGRSARFGAERGARS